MKPFADETQARDYARQKAHRANGREIYVVVEGPDDGEWTVMSIREAIADGFLYSWEV